MNLPIPQISGLPKYSNFLVVTIIVGLAPISTYLHTCKPVKKCGTKSLEKGGRFRKSDQNDAHFFRKKKAENKRNSGKLAPK